MRRLAWTANRLGVRPFDCQAAAGCTIHKTLRGIGAAFAQKQTKS
jgi:hypothetical protein